MMAINSTTCDEPQGSIAITTVDESEVSEAPAKNVEAADEDKLGIGKRIRETRLARGQSRVYVAKHCGVTPQAISNWEKTGAISRNHLVEYAKIASVSVEWLSTGKGQTTLAASSEPRGELDQAHLHGVMAAIFEALGKPGDQAEELARSILRVCSRRSVGDQLLADPRMTADFVMRLVVH